MAELYDSKQSVFKIKDTGDTLRDVSKYITNLIGLPGEAPLIDTTCFGDSGETSVKGKSRSPFAIDLKWSDDVSVGPDIVFAPLLLYDTPVDFEYYPAGTASGKVKYSGKCLVEICTDAVKVGEYIEMAVALRVYDGYTRALVP